MILHSDILSAVADAIEASADVRATVARYRLGYRLLVGVAGEQEMQAEDNRAVIAVYAGDTAYDLGYIQERTAPAVVRVAVWDKEVAADGVREDYEGVMACLDLCHYIAEAAKAITGLGDDLLQAAVTVDATAWPMTVGTIALGYSWPVALNSEATL
jgi:hypothetical protein